MYDWEYLCFQCEVEPTRDGKFFCSTTNKGCKIKQGVDAGELPERALRVGAPVVKQNTVGLDDVPLWKQQDKMTDFCADVMKYPESQVRWFE